MKSSSTAAFVLFGLLAACSQEPARPWSPGDRLARVPDAIVGLGSDELERSLRRGQPRLPVGTTLCYRIAPLVAGGVLLEAEALGGEGVLRVALVRIDPATGAESGARFEQDLACSGTRLRHTLPLEADGTLRELRLTWHSPEPSSSLELLQLTLAEAAPAPRPPIVLISIDTLAASHLSLYGYPLETSPFLRRLAGESCVFENAYTNAPWTLPSFLALMSGLPARAHMLATKGSVELWERWHLDGSRWTLAEFLRSCGYRTAGFVDNPWLSEAFGFPQGFDVFDPTAAQNEHEKLADPDGGIRQVRAAAGEFLEGLAPGSPFFLFVHCFDVHGPYAAPAPFEGMFDGEARFEREREAAVGGPANVYGIVPTYVARGELPEGALPARMRTAPFEAAYDAGIRFVDAELELFFEGLAASGVLDRAWVIVTADHGETMADTDYYFGHGVLDQDVLRVPLLVRPPGGLPGGRRLEDPVQLIDLYPTLQEIVHPASSRAHLRGSSLLPLVQGAARASEPIVCETGPLRQATLVFEGWKVVELLPAQEVQKQVLLSITGGERGFVERALGELATAPASERERCLAWQQDAELVREFMEVLPRTGLTEELFARLQARAGFESLLAFLRHALREPRHELYDLRADPRARHDLARSEPEKLAEMLTRLRTEQARTESVRIAGRAEAPTLSDEQAQVLEDIGYGGESAEDD